jgi:hypothetical protein
MIKSMKSTILAACMVPLAAIGQAHAADTGTSDFTIQGTADPVCQLPAPAGNGTNVAVEGSSITVGSLINENDATVQPFTATLTFPQAMCNYSAWVSIKSENEGLQFDGEQGTAVAESGAFLTHVDYTVNANWGSVALPQLNTATGANEVAQQANGPNQADLVVIIAAPGSTMPLPEGQYTDTLKIQIGLQM